MRLLRGFRDFVTEVRDPKPRMKPGITFFRLFVFLVLAVGLSIAAISIATINPPSPDDCDAKGIDSRDLKEGTCTEGESTLVVVDRRTTLKLETLEARLLTIGYRKAPTARSSLRSARERLITFDLSVKNLTDDPLPIGAGNFVLNAGRPRSEDATFEKNHEPHAFVARDQTISPQRTVEGTVTFRVPSVAAGAVREGGNLDVANLGDAVSLVAPRSIFFRHEYGVIRTYH